MKPDIYIRVRFKTTAEGGRLTSVKRKQPLGVDFYACPLMIDGVAYDCRLLLGDGEFQLGIYYDIPVKFLNRELVLPSLFVGKKIVLWEGREVATGEVSKVCD